MEKYNLDFESDPTPDGGTRPPALSRARRPRAGRARQARGRIYEPPADAPQALFRHRLNDELLSMLTDAQPRVSQMLDLGQLVDAARVPTYDVLPPVP